jgi:methylmalonyl-CoA mutase N-terminal domain/subunit
MEERIASIMDEVEAHGGMVRGVEDGYVQHLIADEAMALQHALESGERKVVGVNCFQTDAPPPEPEAYELDQDGQRRQLDRLAEVRRTRDDAGVRRSLAVLATAARAGDVNLMRPLIECARAYCSVGEMVDVLKGEWGEFRQPAVF